MKLEKLLDNKYKIIDKIGQGGMGKVYLAENIKLGTMWAIKEIDIESDNNAVREHHILKRLKHPSLPRIFDIFEENNNMYIVEDYIEGITLDALLRKKGCFNEETVIKWAVQLCDVLKYLHGFKPNPLIYRDMKPSNIILSDKGTLKLVDFGISREYKPESSQDTVFIGTRGYAAPEQFGEGQSTVATDIYSLGVTLYFLLTGYNPSQPPYELRPLRELDRSFSEEIERIIKKCTRSDPEERYKNIDELLTDIKLSYNMGNKRESTEYSPVKSFKRMILTVFENTEFAVEMAYITAKYAGLKVVLIECDNISSKMDIYLNISRKLKKISNEENHTLLEKLCKKFTDNFSVSEAFEKVCLKPVKGLYVLCKSRRSGEKPWQVKDIIKIIEAAYSYFDLVITVNTTELLNREFLKKVDFLVAPVQANTDSIRENKNFIDCICNQLSFPIEKVKYAAFEYKKGIQLPCGILKKILDPKSFLGVVEYKIQREKCRNIDVYFIENFHSDVKEEYKCILNNFNISVVTKKLTDRLFGRMKRFLTRLRNFIGTKNANTGGAL